MITMVTVYIVFGAWFMTLIVLMIGWHKAMSRKLPLARSSFRISVLVPFRNEAAHLERLITSLSAQQYDPQLTEVLFCNDHSTDGSEAVVLNCIAGLKNFSLLHAQGDGKKNALTEGARKATGDIIVTTDADCIAPPQWLSSINSCYQHPEVKMIFGGVCFEDTGSFFSALQSAEFVSLVATAAATAGLGAPVMCNGANLSFLRSVFFEVDGYAGNAHIPSGDDEFLMRKVLAKYPSGISFMNRPEAVVRTIAQKSITTFLQQRFRWAGKWRHNNAFNAKLLAVFVVLFQATFVGLVSTTIAGYFPLKEGLLLIALKIVLEGIFLFQCGTFLGKSWRTIPFLTLQIVYPFYVLFVGVMGNFVKVRWKGR